MSLYGAGLALLEQNLHTLKSQGCFDKANIADVMMKTREQLEWHFKQLDHAVGLSFRSNFHFALVGHLIKVKRIIEMNRNKIFQQLSLDFPTIFLRFSNNLW